MNELTPLAAFWLIAIPLISTPLIYLAGRLQVSLAAGTGMGGGRKLVTANGQVVVATTSATPRTPAPDVARWLGLMALAATWAPFIGATRDLIANGPAKFGLESIALRFDGLSLLLALLALGLGTLVMLFSGQGVSGAAGTEKYYTLLVAMVGLMIGLACAGDIFNLWIWFEGMAVASYLLVGFHHEEPAALEASVKYLVQSAAGSVLVLLSIALILAQTGTLNLEEIRNTAHTTPGLLAAGALLMMGFGVKGALVPLHTWLPDAHAQAPSGISAMLSGVVVMAGIIAILRSLAALAGVTPSWGSLLIGFGVLNIAFGNLMALRQTQVKRLLAYSTLSHIGYILLGVGIGVAYGQPAGTQGGLFHMLTHGVMKGLAFLAAGAFLYGLQPLFESDRGKLTQRSDAAHASPLLISDLAGAAQRYPLVAFTLSLALLGLGGLPPLAGFMSKWQIFVAGFATQNPVVGGLVIFAALNSVLSLAYYMPLVNMLYRQAPSKLVEHGRAIPLTMLLPLGLLAVTIVAIGIWPGLVYWLIEPAGRVLLASFGG
ncbi:MAG: hypothetical protein EXR62_05115 [Chloroflexi bacterium]|nr:hypothetical protein [Chloroflexota bacterium]